MLKETGGWEFENFDHWSASKIYMANVFAFIMGAVSSMSGNDGTFYLFPTF